ncbi:MAG: phosphate ABC transporter permease subunit PstC [Lachnospiraceae bacterium]|jgi:phosphate transport system permease protein|nr:phosphate ABC transporter permease subunit PstC [Lachnospiraceae bacterium]MDD7326441.1 phosphate ABC transporter permease subunit PstC [Lachnospiraceae bacterium]MDY2759187.1 phosphate ABC transporter permease subunit PstC [Lachnospiraceae bacterium]
MDTTARLKKQKGIENFFHTMFLIFGLFSIAFVLFITIFLVISGVPAITKIGFFKFIFGTKWASTASNPSFGILPFILTSVYGTCGALLVSVPVGIFCAAYLAKMAPGPVAAVVREAVDLLAGIPSVVYGLFGMIIIVPGVRKLFNLPDGANLFSATVVLAIMVLPSIISESETALRAVPKEYEEGSLALGATYTETIFKVTLPAARSGVLTSVILGTGRAIGEAMAVMMVAGNVANMPGIFRSVRFLTTAVASEMSYSSGLQRQALFSIALVLFFFIILINVVLRKLTSKGEVK